MVADKNFSCWNVIIIDQTLTGWPGMRLKYVNTVSSSVIWCLYCELRGIAHHFTPTWLTLFGQQELPAFPSHFPSDSVGSKRAGLQLGWREIISTFNFHGETGDWSGCGQPLVYAGWDWEILWGAGPGGDGGREGPQGGEHRVSVQVCPGLPHLHSGLPVLGDIHYDAPDSPHQTPLSVGPGHLALHHRHRPERRSADYGCCRHWVRLYIRGL